MLLKRSNYSAEGNATADGMAQDVQKSACDSARPDSLYHFQFACSLSGSYSISRYAGIGFEIIS